VTPRAARPEDAQAVAALLRAAFGRAEEAALVAALRAEGAVAVELVAEAERGELLGHLLLSRMRVAGASALALAPLAVAPRAQRRGVGTALLRHGLALAVTREECWCLVLGEPAYYARFGFSAAAAAGVTGVPWAGHPAFQARALRPGVSPPTGPARYACAFGLPDPETPPADPGETEDAHDRTAALRSAEHLRPHPARRDPLQEGP
jgi:putative acetyltransferase